MGASHRLMTTDSVIDELRDEKTREIVESLPFEIKRADADEKSLNFVKEFARKTGDLASLSEVDLELLALAHTLYERENLE